MRVSQKYTLLGATAGLLNGLLGAGGGVLVVPLLEKMGVPPRKAHAVSLAIMLPISIAGAVSFWLQGVRVPGTLLFSLLPAGFLGALVGSRLLVKIRTVLLRRIFGLFLLASGLRLLLR